MWDAGMHLLAVALKVENVNRCKCCNGGAGLQCHYNQGLLWTARQPLDAKEYEDRQLTGHEQLPEMGRSPLIGFASSPKDSDVEKHDRERGKRHCHGKKGTRLCDHVWNRHTPITFYQKLNRVKHDLGMSPNARVGPSENVVNCRRITPSPRISCRRYSHRSAARTDQCGMRIHESQRISSWRPARTDWSVQLHGNRRTRQAT